MHELSVALSLLDVAAEEAERRGGVVVEAVHVRVGALSGVVPQALTAAFELAREGSAFPKVQLIIEEVPVTIECPVCQAVRPAESIQRLCCLQCGTPAANVVTGRELDLSALEIVDGEGGS